VCEWGNDPNPSCNEVITCNSSGWSTPPPTHCPPGTCPARYVDVPKEMPCSPDGLDCAYKEGQCDCAFTLPTGGVSPVWQCASPPGCPEPRPRIGSSCTQQGLSCDYGACTGGVEVQCTGGVWQQMQTACPV
jgi:hypothetical protein